MSFFQRLKEGLSKTHRNLVGKLGSLVRGGGGALSPAEADDFLEALITSDMGVPTSEHIVAALKERMKRGDARDQASVLPVLKEILATLLRQGERQLAVGSQHPWVVMMVGVNGSGKTTTTGKLGHRWRREGHSVSLVAADTFRAGAVEQLRIWADRVGCGFYAGNYGADPSSVVFDAIQAATGRGEDILLVDTAGRLHTSTNLMEELKKVKRTCAKALPGAPHEILLVLDANTGQNGLAQAGIFHQALTVSGVVLTKLDHTAKGGIIAPVVREVGIPVALVGVGEDEESLQDFRADEFVEALFAD
jgi:fused signal recognition particle receptor